MIWMQQEEILEHAKLYTQQRKLVEREMEKLMYSLMELNNSLATLKEVKTENGLVPIGGGAFLKAKLEGEKTLIPIGAGYMAEYSVKEAGEEVSKRIVLTEKAMGRMREEMDKIDAEMRKLEGEFRKHQHESEG